MIDWYPGFVADSGVTSELFAGDNYLRKLGDEYIDMITGKAYNPALQEFGGTYTLKLKNLTELVIDARSGDLLQIVDAVS